MARVIKQARTYRGVVIWHNPASGYALRWTALGGLAADTLEGIKRLIRMSQQNAE